MRTASQRQREPRRYHRFAENDGRVRALVAELDELRTKYDEAIAKLREADGARFAPDIQQFLRSEAHARHMKIEALVKAIIEAVVEDKLFSAVLDG